MKTVCCIDAGRACTLLQIIYITLEEKLQTFELVFFPLLTYTILPELLLVIMMEHLSVPTTLNVMSV